MGQTPGCLRLAVKNPSFLLAAALGTFALAGALTPLVVIGLLGLVLFSGGLLLVALALRAGRDGGDASDASDAGLGSLGMVWCGALLVAVSAFHGGSLAFSVAIHRVHPAAIAPPASVSASVAGLLMALAGAAMFSAGLRHRPGFGSQPWLAWFAAAIGVFPAAALLFFMLSPRLPITA